MRKDQIEAIESLFMDICDVDILSCSPGEVCFSVSTQDSTLTMCGTLLDTLQAISRITGFPEVNEGYFENTPGCETCDYGSVYGYSFRAFGPEANPCS